MLTVDITFGGFRRRVQDMTDQIRTFGVKDHDAYWQNRQNANDTKERPLHRFLAALANEVAPGGGTVLDCGVGDGHTFRLCAQRHDVWGVELSPQAIALSGCPPEKIRQADLNDGIPDFGFRFDVIIVSHVMHWLHDPGLFLDRARERLAPGGKLVLLVPNITNYHHRIRFLFGRFPPVSPSHKNFQTPAELEGMSHAHGWKILRRTTPKTSFRARLWPTLFAADLVYVLADSGPGGR
jgi:SAM-dependent methyltransferase